MLAPIRSDPASRRRLAVVDGLRGLAILMVIFYHCWGLLPKVNGDRSTGLIDAPLAHLFGFGWSGVDLFFVISGFLITGNLYDAQGSPTYFRSFYARRFLRVFPLYYVFLIVVLFLVPLSTTLAQNLQVDALRNVQWFYWTYTMNVAASLRATADKIPIVYSHIWSLCVEEQFYLLWPAILLCTKDRRRLMRLLLGAVGLALVARWLFTLEVASRVFRENAAYSLLPCRMDTFAFGGWLALAVRGDAAEVARLRRLGPALVAVALAGLAAIYVARHGIRPFDVPQQTIGFSLLTLGFGGLLVMILDAAPHAALRWIFESAPLLAAGKFSYGLYVVHLAVAAVVIPRVVHAWWTRPVAGSVILANLGFLALAGAGSLAIAWASWHLLEKPALALKRYVPYGRAPGRETAWHEP